MLQNEGPSDMMVKETIDMLKIILLHFQTKYENTKNLIYFPLVNTLRALAYIHKYKFYKD